MHDMPQIQQLTVNFNQQLLAPHSPPPDSADLDNFLQFVPNLITHEDNQVLLAPVSMTEVQKIVFSINPNSAAG